MGDSNKQTKQGLLLKFNQLSSYPKGVDITVICTHKAFHNLERTSTTTITVGKDNNLYFRTEQKVQ